MLVEFLLRCSVATNVIIILSVCLSASVYRALSLCDGVRHPEVKVRYGKVHSGRVCLS